MTTRITYRYTLATGELIEAEHLPTARAAAYQAAHDDNTTIIDGPEVIESPAPHGWTHADTSTEDDAPKPPTPIRLLMKRASSPDPQVRHAAYQQARREYPGCFPEEEEDDEAPYTSPDDYPGTMQEDHDHARELDHYGGPHPTTYTELHTYDDRAHTLKLRAGSAYQRHDGAQRRTAHRLGLTITNSATDRQLVARERLWKGSRLP
jgi:hypothetical protein